MFDIQLSNTGAVTRLSLSRVVDCPHDWSGHLTRQGLRSLLVLERSSDCALLRQSTKVEPCTRSKPNNPDFAEVSGVRLLTPATGRLQHAARHGQSPRPEARAEQETVNANQSMGSRLERSRNEGTLTAIRGG